LGIYRVDDDFSWINGKASDSELEVMGAVGDFFDVETGESFQFPLLNLKMEGRLYLLLWFKCFNQKAF